MFSKSPVFPKAADPQAARGQRIGPGNFATAQPAGLTSSSAETSPSPRDAGASSGAGGTAASSPLPRANEVAEDAGYGSGSRLIVGPEVKLKGAEILDCDTLIVEGRVEATMDSRVIRIAESGSFAGTVGIDIAEIRGRFDGELTARTQLVIHATGRVSGKIRYGKILIEEGGELSGDVQSLASAKEAGRVVPREESTPKVAVVGAG
ncbi:bactofilin family protein [Aromatoleum anaerobium]|uniref:Polymer-forming cytoskeletal protein n=1 Tax=Aromatoleum anaerobium TaxID=182180 RepID=A0ABX1PI62_9RHOO|nr:polymer-forming cytoskeletal protein [Aromatoleum anaerobium]MCK0506982.1 polymer-forming cytoskeletal protein [Aromatoleum anaerobium]